MRIKGRNRLIIRKYSELCFRLFENLFFSDVSGRSVQTQIIVHSLKDDHHIKYLTEAHLQLSECIHIFFQTCCSDQIISRNDSLCCDNQIIKKTGPTQECCGNKVHNYNTHLCCHTYKETILYPRNGSTDLFCCDEKSYHYSNQICCGGQVYSKNKYICCDNKAYPTNGVKLGCCYGKPIDRSKQLCCPKLGVADVDDKDKASCCPAGSIFFYIYTAECA